MIKLANKSALASILGGDEGMEKKALSLAELLRMSRNAANKGKLRRFSELLDKRNRAIDNVAQARYDAIANHSPIAYIEADLLGHYKGPEMKAYQRLLNRSIAEKGNPVNTNRVINFRNDSRDTLYDRLTVKNDLYGSSTGPWTLKDLAEYSTKQKPSNPIDKPTYPGL